MFQRRSLGQRGGVKAGLLLWILGAPTILVIIGFLACRA